MNKLTSYLVLSFQMRFYMYNDSRVIEINERVENQTKADKKIVEVGHVAYSMSHRIAIQAAEDGQDEHTLILGLILFQTVHLISIFAYDLLIFMFLSWLGWVSFR
ncbi:uncharacterized protein MELLADRAFT_72124 [Melampsora larici-populina 98AG31]|uniref:Uncharacterized protein n=1 Tax=Melampsora larici-populina (strain 98AG31 / pathotype 3-4-7) TaxID=747676 RepID=F4RQI0_MELLP|nr:uncharacterized protein MELLADRAFT_72124 [Melampsora larici-populina 98AG31]EGG05509.1 hypothetical protein MELLADRAFT_72124 [Melampsora larici-populina 98AG31]